MGNQRQVSFVDNTQDVYHDGSSQDNCHGYGNEEYVENNEEVNYVGNQGNFNSNFKPFNTSHPNFSYRNPNVENPQDQQYPSNTQAQATSKPFNNFNNQARPQQAFNQPRPNFQQGNFQPRYNNQGGFQPRGSNFQQQGPSQPQQPQDLDIKAMFQTIMEGQVKGQRETEKRFKEMQVQVDQVTANVKSLESRVAQVASSSKPPTGTFPGKVETNPKSPCNVVLGSEDEGKKVIVKGGCSKDEKTLKKPYEDPMEKFRKIVALVEEEERLEREALEASREASTFRGPQRLKTLHKQDDPGKFNIPICLGGRVFDDALCDSGSYANVISWELVQELGIEGMNPHPKPLTFGDASKKVPKGVIEKFPIMIGDCAIESDLLVVDMVDSRQQPILLGASFLQTTGAVIDYVRGVVTLKHVGDHARFSIVPSRDLVGTVIRSEATFTIPKELLKVEANHHSRDKPNTMQEVLTVEATISQSKKAEVTSSLFMDLIDNGLQLDNEVPSFEEATSQATGTKLKVPAVSSCDLGDFELKKLFGEEGFPKEVSRKIVATKAKKKKVKQVPNDPQVALPSNLTFKPLMLVDGKIDCQVQCKGYSKPFHKVRILLDPTTHSKGDSPMVTLKMANLFGMDHVNPEPSDGGSSLST